MRRKDRALDSAEILGVIKSCQVFRLAMVDGQKPYLIPLNFGYQQKNGKLSFYFHCAKQGRKLDILYKNPLVCFEMDTDHQLSEGDIPCMYGYLYASVMGEGTVAILEDAKEKAEALNLLMKHQTGKEFIFTLKQTDAVVVCRVDVDSLSGKARKK